MKKAVLIFLCILYVVFLILMAVTMKPGQEVPGSFSAAKVDSSISVFAALAAMLVSILIAFLYKGEKH
ncbi:hypothetical protein HZA33_04905 [Candidatus Pacearchaeota archaeon]|nr:hypothetical protein [Candidatus Pacearchaeota archaeon]